MFCIVGRTLKEEFFLNTSTKWTKYFGYTRKSPVRTTSPCSSFKSLMLFLTFLNVNEKDQLKSFSHDVTSHLIDIFIWFLLSQTARAFHRTRRYKLTELWKKTMKRKLFIRLPDRALSRVHQKLLYPICQTEIAFQNVQITLSYRLFHRSYVPS